MAELFSRYVTRKDAFSCLLDHLEIFSVIKLSSMSYHNYKGYMKYSKTGLNRERTRRSMYEQFQNAAIMLWYLHFFYWKWGREIYEMLQCDIEQQLAWFVAQIDLYRVLC